MKALPKTFLQNRAAVFDWVVFIISFSLGFIFPTIGDFVLSPAFSWWMLIVLVCYTTGTWLKHLPLSYRMSVSTAGRREIPWVIFLVAGHWVLMLLVILFAEPAISKVFGFHSIMEKNSENIGYVFIAMFFAGYLTWLVYHSKKYKNIKKNPSKTFLFRRELVADILLTASVSILTFVTWEKGVLAMLSYKTVGSFSDVWFLFVFLSMAYLVCYLPLRYLYLIEDHSSRQTWRRMLLIFAFLLLRSLFEILRVG